MNIETRTNTVAERVIDYYNECWVNRFKAGHNPDSLAMHMGYFDTSETENETAKINTNQFIADFVSLPQNKSIAIADLGCGIGGTCIYLAKKYPLVSVTGVNISAEQIELANLKTASNSLTNRVNFIKADYANTYLPSNSFDCVIAIESICHAESKEQVYKEACRILKNGGTFVFMDYFETRNAINTIEEEHLANFREGWAVNTYIQNNEGFLAQFGFDNIQEQTITDKVLPGILHSYSKAIEKLQTGTNNVNNTFVRHLNACVSLKHLVENNLIAYKITSGQKV